MIDYSWFYCCVIVLIIIVYIIFFQGRSEGMLEWYLCGETDPQVRLLGQQPTTKYPFTLTSY